MTPTYLKEEKLNWKPLELSENHFLKALNNQFRVLNSKYWTIFPNLRLGNTILAASDYSGEHSNSDFIVFSFLLTTLESWERWETNRIDIRQTYLSDLRRMSFKRLGDKQRRACLIPLLDAASNLDGISLSVSLHKKCHVFNRPPLDFSNPDFSPYRQWKTKVLEKALFATHIMALLLAGLGAPMQNIFWFSDEDAIAANNKRLGELTQLFAWISSLYLPFTMGHLRCGTSRSDNGTLQLEDFLAIPDLVAGALSEQLNLHSPQGGNQGNIFWIFRPDMSDKTKVITNWFADISCQLKKIFCVIEPSPNGIEQVISCHHFYNR